MQSPENHGGAFFGRSDRDWVICDGRSLRIKMNSALNRPVEDWGKLLGDVAAVTAMLDRILHHGHVLKCGPRSWRTKAAAGNSQ
jgi:DNA replication protein DnaC